MSKELELNERGYSDGSRVGGETFNRFKNLDKFRQICPCCKFSLHFCFYQPHRNPQHGNLPFSQ